MGRVFQIEYPSITLHATSRGESGPFVYCQLDEPQAEEGAPASDDNDDDETPGMRELSLTPQDSASRACSFPGPVFLMHPLCYAKRSFMS